MVNQVRWARDAIGSAVTSPLNARRIWTLVAGGLLLWVFVRSFGSGVLDLRVYLAGGEAWLAGTDLYTTAFHTPANCRSPTRRSRRCCSAVSA